MDDTGGPRDEDLAETTRQQNSNLRRLIDAVGTLLAGSRELLKRLQPLSEGEPSNDKTRIGRTTPHLRPDPHQTSSNPATRRKSRFGTRIAVAAFDCGHLHPAPPPGSSPNS